MGVLSNNEGKILRSNQTGNVLKQNYNFSNGFFDGGIGAYIQCPNNIIDPRQPFSIIGIINTGNLAVQTDPLFQILGDGNQFAYLRVLRGTATTQARGLLSVDFRGVQLIDRVKLLVGVSLGSANGTLITSEGIQISSRVSINDYANYTINLYKSDAALEYPDGYIRERADDILIYDREISQSEWNYFYNNKLGNEPLSEKGLKAYYKHDIYEILSFGGVDSVCTRDHSGHNNHAKIIGLPSGTLQEQLDYANSNLLRS